ncbi:rhomboid family intramembrane serine protease [Pseudohalioglobus lutimaris]|uniref:Rhomboid family intramembrane serine protease n=1 Tax=Pseudohalioglobus lutimaris TaxID=1737061 RepID=A0A2N5WY56_9GAMM|nr:rhomboid family intramembrane serine protease [Pseudohalioglobus lutimaris]PLW67167.1 rhomboid family intramembrane serine protease [Pseudohalioglobus lutimaris]
MPDRFHVLSVPLDEDLLPLTALLRTRGVPHQIFEEAGEQVLVVFKQENVRAVAGLYRAWRAGEVRIEAREGGPPAARMAGVQWRSAPVTLTFALLGIGVFLAFFLGAPEQWLALLTFTPFDVVGGQVQFLPMGEQYWRLVTPILLHFGWLHITFNSLWLWELGSRTERAVGSLNTLGILLVIAVLSNVGQHVFGGPGLFGGMSGVVYGLLGFAWVAPQLQPRWQIQPARPIMLFMVGWLLLCLFGVVEMLGFGSIANAAHLGGLVSGAVLGLLLGGLSRLQHAA